MASKKKFDVFLSHNSQDKPWVIKLKAALEAYKVKVWLDKDEIRPGDIFAEALEKGINESRAVALIISPEAMQSGWVKAEYYRALNLATNGQLQLIPVLYRKAQIPGFLGTRSWVDFREESEYDSKVRDLVWGITGIKPAADPSVVIDLQDPKQMLFKEIRSRIESAQKIVEYQKGFFSSGISFYDDQFQHLTKQADELKSIVEQINSELPASFNTTMVVSNLDTHARIYRSLLIDLQKTGPTGDKILLDRLIEQLDLLSKAFVTLANNLKG